MVERRCGSFKFHHESVNASEGHAAVVVQRHETVEIHGRTHAQDPRVPFANTPVRSTSVRVYASEVATSDDAQLAQMIFRVVSGGIYKSVKVARENDGVRSLDVTDPSLY